MPSSSQPLPSAEANLFKKVLKCYELKQYKKGLQNVKEILKKFPDHGETLSMKGLILNYTNKKTEAYECAKKGLAADIKSHVCWHVYGLIQRSDRKYDESIKCYRNALRCDKDNLQILRDLSLLQIQIRDLEGYRDTRYQLFQLRPTQRASWLGYAMSYHLLKDYDTSLSVLEEFAKTQPTKQYDYEHSEFLLYQNMVMREASLYSQALEHITKNESSIVDKLVVEEIKGECFIRLNNALKVDEIYNGLIERNPDNLSYYKKLEKFKNFQTIDEKTKFYEHYATTYPRSDLPRKLPLEFLEGDSFKASIHLYLQRALHKGVPPLFKELKYLYKNQEKLEIIQEILLDYVKNLREISKFTREQAVKETPTSLLWTYYYLAQHYDYLNDTENALKYINLAIDDTPTLVELYMLKGKIYKHAGNLYEAVKWLDEAQSFDTADRYINYKCSKYMLRADLVQEAQDMCAKFTREGVSAFEYLKEMQCMWFETECANSYMRQEKYGEALKKCHQVERHFQEIIEDQFDFHSYCMRKMTLRSYVDMLRLEDRIKSHPFFFKAAQTAIQIYLRLHDNPLSDLDSEKIQNAENLTPSELKKLKNKQKKSQMKAQQEREEQAKLEAKKKEISKNKNKEDGDVETIAEDDLVAEKLERPENPLEECSKFLKPIEEFASQHFETHILAFEVYSRKQRYLLMMKALKKMKSLNSNSPKLHFYLATFLLKYQQEKSKLNAALVSVIDEELKSIHPSGEQVDKLNEDFLEKNATYLECAIEGVKVLRALDPTANKQKCLDIVTHFDSFTQGYTLQNAIQVFNLVSNGYFGQPINQSLVDDLRQKLTKKWPHANAFHTKKQLELARRTCIDATSFHDALNATKEQLDDETLPLINQLEIKA